MKLSDRNWKPFYISELFEIENCKCSNVSQFSSGNIPYIGATNRNNGVLKYIQNDLSKITQGNCIVFICDGDGSIGYNIYKKENFIGSTTLKVGRNKFLNKYIGLFITTVTDRARNIYNFGYKRNETHLKNEKIYLPMNNEGQPDYEFMEAYMREKENKLKNQYKQFISFRLKNECKKPNQSKEWKVFEIDKVFSYIKRGKRHISKNRKIGKIPYYSASSDNNGITDFIANPVFLIDKISIVYSTFGDAYYSGNNYTASDEMNIFSNKKINKYNALFIVQALKQNKNKYSFARKAFTNKILKDKILLPITKAGEPDYEYMENYMKYLEQQKLKQYLEYIEK